MKLYRLYIMFSLRVQYQQKKCLYYQVMIYGKFGVLMMILMALLWIYKRN